MNSQSLVQYNKNGTDLVLSTEQTALVVEASFAKALSTFKVGTVNSDYQKIMAFNKVSDREYKQHELFAANMISYIADIPLKHLADNNIYVGKDRFHILDPVIYVFIDQDTQDLAEFVKGFVQEGFSLRVYINITDYAIYTSIASFVHETYPDAEIISENTPPRLFNPDLHYNVMLDKNLVVWEKAPPGVMDGKLPFVDSSPVGNVVNPLDTCIYMLLDGHKFLTKPALAEAVGFRAASLALDWNENVKTICEYVRDICQISTIPVYYKHFVQFGGLLRNVTLDLEYIHDVLRNPRPMLRRNISKLNIEEPGDQDLYNAILEDCSYSRERLFLLDGVLCLMEKVTPNIHLTLADKVYFEGRIDVIDHKSSCICFMNPLHGDVYSKLAKTDIFNIPKTVAEYVKRVNDCGTGWWSKFNRRHSVTLKHLLKLYTLDKLIALNIYTPSRGFTAESFTLDMKHMRWFSGSLS